MFRSEAFSENYALICSISRHFLMNMDKNLRYRGIFRKTCLYSEHIETFSDENVRFSKISRHIQWDMHGRCTFSSSGYYYLFPKAALGVPIILIGLCKFGLNALRFAEC